MSVSNPAALPENAVDSPSSPSSSEPRAVAVSRPLAGWWRLAEYVELTKPRISAMALLTVAVAAAASSSGSPPVALLVHVLAGTALVAASASACNQWLERDTDRLMARTAGRPLPAGRLMSWEVVLFGAITLAAGLVYLGLAVGLVTCALGLGTWLLYVCLYTPLKRVSPQNTAVGAVAGAMPVLMGWSAAAPLSLEAAALFLIVYLWQFPHFMAIAWLYRRQYAAAGLKMATVVDPTGGRAARQAIAAAVALVPVSVLPAVFGVMRIEFAAGALVLSAAQGAFALAFALRRDERSARWLLRASLVYLPSLLLLLLWARIV
ncbi:MAG: protoheme IX farnesyltransferase [Planctomycetia bacterium]|nr:protoheme IX farnesyltransferase [Planctomycetia bacterium]